METERLRLRPFETSDAPVVQRLAGNFEIARTTLNVPHPYPDGAAESWIQNLHVAAAEGHTYGYAIIRKADNVLLGAVSLRIDQQHKRAELAYWLGSLFWGQGYTTEAARKLVEFGFVTLGLNRIFAFAMTKNLASTRVMQKIGMKYEGTLRHHICKWGEFEDLAAYGLLRSEFERDKPLHC